MIINNEAHKTSREEANHLLATMSEEQLDRAIPLLYQWLREEGKQTSQPFHREDCQE